MIMHWRSTPVICVALALLVLAVYWRAASFEFVNLDDPDNVQENSLVTGGMSIDNIVTALRTSHPDYWRPMTWLSLMADSEIYGYSPGHALPRGYHITNVVLHTVNVILLFLTLQNVTGAIWRSAFVAAFFAVHPMHVESVAWITERKDVLSAFFGILCIWMYAQYARRRGWWRYLLSAGLLGVGLMAKPMLVPLPVVLLLLDIWPLGRWSKLAPTSLPEHRPVQSTTLHRLVIEKIPMFIISAASCVMTMRGGRGSVIDVPLQLRLVNAMMSYVQYLLKLVWPADLAVYYPYHGLFGSPSWPAWQVAAAATALLVLSIIAIACIRKFGFIFVGWCWYLAMLVPVIGLLQVGVQGMADRFVYFPFIGLYVAIIWGCYEVVRRSRLITAFGAAFACILLACFAFAAVHQLQFWRDTESLYDHAASVTQHNWKIHDYYGNYLVTRKQNIPRATDQFEKLVAIRNDDATSQMRLAALYVQQARYVDAQRCLEAAIRLEPNNPEAHYNIAIVYWRRDDRALAFDHIERAIALNPDHALEYRKMLASWRSQ